MEFDQNSLDDLLSEDDQINEFAKLRGLMKGYNFRKPYGNIYIGRENVTEEICVLAVQHLQRKLKWFDKTITVLRMLHIKDETDLLQAINVNLEERDPDLAYRIFRRNN